MSRKKTTEGAAEPQPNGTDTQTMSPGDAPSDTNGNAEAEPKKRPCHKFGPYPCDGRGTSVKVAIWDREVDLQDGRVITVYSCTMEKSYRDVNGNWATTSIIKGSELPIVIHALQMAHQWILEARNGKA